MRMLLVFGTCMGWLVVVVWQPEKVSAARKLTPSEGHAIVAGAPVVCTTPTNTGNNACDACGGPDGDGFYWKCTSAANDQDCINWSNGGEAGYVQNCDWHNPGQTGCGGNKFKFAQAGCVNQVGMGACGRNFHAVTGGIEYRFAGCP